MPDAELRRIAVLTDAPPAPADYDARMVGEPAGSYVAKVFNRPRSRRRPIPGSGGIMSARGLARHYAMLANWGELDGVRVLPEARIRAGIELQSFEWDEVYRVRVRRSLGYRRGSDYRASGVSRRLRPRRWRRLLWLRRSGERLGIGFAKNYFTYTTGGAVNQGRPVRAASNVVAEAVFDALGLKR